MAKWGVNMAKWEELLSRYLDWDLAWDRDKKLVYEDMKGRMETQSFGNVEIRFFRGNDNMFIMYKGHRFFIDRKDIADFIRAFEVVENGEEKEK